METILGHISTAGTWEGTTGSEQTGALQCTLENEALKSPKKLFPLILLIKWGKCGVNIGNGSVWKDPSSKIKNISKKIWKKTPPPLREGQY